MWVCYFQAFIHSYQFLYWYGQLVGHQPLVVQLCACVRAYVRVSPYCSAHDDSDYEILHVCRLHMRDGAIHYKLYLLKLTMAVDNNIVSRIIKGEF